MILRAVFVGIPLSAFEYSIFKIQLTMHVMQ